MEAESEIDPEENDGFPDFGKHCLSYSPIFEVELNMAKKTSIKLRLEPLEVVYSKLCFERVRGFM
jgi:hypothetical protein